MDLWYVVVLHLQEKHFGVLGKVSPFVVERLLDSRVASGTMLHEVREVESVFEKMLLNLLQENHEESIRNSPYISSKVLILH